MGRWGRGLATERSNLTLIASRPVLQGPEAIVEGHRVALTQRVTAMRSAIERRLASERQQLTRSRATLTALSPQATLDRGYALLKTPSGALITSSAQVKKGDLIEGILASGRMVAQVVGATNPTPPKDAPDTGSLTPQGPSPGLVPRTPDSKDTDMTTNDQLPDPSPSATRRRATSSCVSSRPSRADRPPSRTLSRCGSAARPWRPAVPRSSTVLKSVFLDAPPHPPPKHANVHSVDPLTRR